jgi:hypothetical protein
MVGADGLGFGIVTDHRQRVSRRHVETVVESRTRELGLALLRLCRPLPPETAASAKAIGRHSVKLVCCEIFEICTDSFGF